MVKCFEICEKIYCLRIYIEGSNTIEGWEHIRLLDNE